MEFLFHGLEITLCGELQRWACSSVRRAFRVSWAARKIGRPPPEPPVPRGRIGTGPCCHDAGNPPASGRGRQIR